MCKDTLQNDLTYQKKKKNQTRTIITTLKGIKITHLDLKANFKIEI